MKIILILLLSLWLYGDTKRDMFDLYQNNKFEEACAMGFDHFYHNKRDEEFVSLYSFACLKSDYIDRLAVPATMLKYSKESRANAAYFSVILMQKKLLYHALLDNHDLSAYKLPTTDYVLSKVFDLYSNLEKERHPKAFYLFEDPKDPKITYKLYLSHGAKITKMIIEEFYDKIAVKRHIYW